jgi:hypothetical protein
MDRAHNNQTPNAAERAQRSLSRLLGTRVSTTVAIAAAHDPLYLHHLLVCRDTPGFLGHLLQNPPDIASIGVSRNGSSTGQILANFARSVISWGRSGFRTVSNEVYQRRLQACSSCPHLVGGYDRGQALSTPGLDGVCSLCGCPVKRKARLATEQCPDISETGNSRWAVISPSRDAQSR